MTTNQIRFVAGCTVAIIGFLLLILTSGCSDDATVQFQSCQEARDAGASLPLHEGDVGWNAKLDGDHDGTACES